MPHPWFRNLLNEFHDFTLLLAVWQNFINYFDFNSEFWNKTNYGFQFYSQIPEVVTRIHFKWTNANADGHMDYI